MTVLIVGEAPDQASVDRFVDALYQSGVRHFVTRLTPDAALMSAEYIAKEKAAGRMADALLTVLYAGAAASDAERARRDAVYPYVAGIVNEALEGARFMAREAVVVRNVGAAD